MRGGNAFWALVLAATSASCTYILGLEDVNLDGSTSSNGTGGAGGTGNPTSASGGGGTTGTAGGGGQGGECAVKPCGAVVIAADQMGPISLVSFGANLYWIAGGEVRSARKGEPISSVQAEFTQSGLNQIAVGGDPSGTSAKICGTTGGTILIGDTNDADMTTVATGVNAKRVAADGSYAYWINEGGPEVMSYSFSGGTSDPIATGLLNMQDIAVGGEPPGVYWATNDSLFLEAGATDTTLMTNVAYSPVFIAVGETMICWIVQTDPNEGVYCQSNSTQTSSPNEYVTVAADILASAIVVYDPYVYWLVDGSIMRRHVDGSGGVETVAADVDATSIAVDGDAVYWTTATSVISYTK